MCTCAKKKYGTNSDANDDTKKLLIIIMKKRRKKENCSIEGGHPEPYNNRWNRSYYSSFLLLLLLSIPLLLSLSLLSVEAFVLCPHKIHNQNHNINNNNHHYHHHYQDLQTQRHYYQSNSNSNSDSNSNNRPVNCRQQGRARGRQRFPTSHSFVASLSSHNRRDFLSQGGIGTSSTVLYFWPGRNDNYNDRPLSRYVDTVDHNYTLAETSQDYIDLRDGQRLVCVGDVHGTCYIYLILSTLYIIHILYIYYTHYKFFRCSVIALLMQQLYTQFSCTLISFVSLPYTFTLV